MVVMEGPRARGGGGPQELHHPCPDANGRAHREAGPPELSVYGHGGGCGYSRVPQDGDRDGGGGVLAGGGAMTVNGEKKWKTTRDLSLDLWSSD